MILQTGGPESLDINLPKSSMTAVLESYWPAQGFNLPLIVQDTLSESLLKKGTGFSDSQSANSVRTKSGVSDMMTKEDGGASEYGYLYTDCAHCLPIRFD